LIQIIPCDGDTGSTEECIALIGIVPQGLVECVGGVIEAASLKISVSRCDASGNSCVVRQAKSKICCEFFSGIGSRVVSGGATLEGFEPK
jgi:hypothetical protein